MPGERGDDGIHENIIGSNNSSIWHTINWHNNSGNA